jgi:L-asparagine transporter-like permease
MQMIAIGGSIGAGLFVGSGSALTSGGPGSLVIDFIIIGFMLLLTVNALGELAGKSAIRNPKIPMSDFTEPYTLSLVLSITTPSVLSTRVGDLPWVGTMP